MSCIHTRARVSATRARTTYMCHARVPHTKTKVQSKALFRGETVSVHEDVKPTGIGE